MSDEKTREKWLTRLERERYARSKNVTRNDYNATARHMASYLRDALDALAEQRELCGLSLPDDEPTAEEEIGQTRQST